MKLFKLNLKLALAVLQLQLKKASNQVMEGSIMRKRWLFLLHLQFSIGLGIQLMYKCELIKTLKFLMPI